MSDFIAIAIIFFLGVLMIYLIKLIGAFLLK